MKVQRDIIQRLKQWQVSENRKPLILKGARQTGKTSAIPHENNQ
ncbi:MAG: hypothetical protein ACP5D9_15280 [Mariniphaga sp.]